MEKRSLLLDADEIIHGEVKVKMYGRADESFRKVAQVASILTGKELTPEDCLLVQISQKLVRNSVTPGNRDHRLDAVGYLGILDDVMAGGDRGQD